MQKLGRLRIICQSLVLGYMCLVFALVQVASVNAQVVPDPLKPVATPIDVPEYSGVQGSIADFLCVPTENNVGTALYDCVGRAYRFSIAFGAIALVFFIVMAGYLYITGGEGSKEKAKGMIKSSITGMVIILSSWVLLSFINPTLVQIRPIQPPIFEASSLPKCEDVGLGANCVLPTGQVKVGSGGTAGSKNEAQYKDLIAKHAQAKGLEYCMLSALIEKESSFNKLIVSFPPPKEVDPSGTPPSYNVNFGTSQHAIGLTQVLIFKGTSSRDGKEFGFDKPLTVQDLIDPETSIKAGAFYFEKRVKDNPGNLREAYDDYQYGPASKPGQDDSSSKSLDKFITMYENCKRRG